MRFTFETAMGARTLQHFMAIDPVTATKQVAVDLHSGVCRAPPHDVCSARRAGGGLATAADAARRRRLTVPRLPAASTTGDRAVCLCLSTAPVIAHPGAKHRRTARRVTRLPAEAEAPVLEIQCQSLRLRRCRKGAGQAAAPAQVHPLVRRQMRPGRPQSRRLSHGSLQAGARQLTLVSSLNTTLACWDCWACTRLLRL